MENNQEKANTPCRKTTIDRCKETFPETPFENIALAFSGGGFRAAAYSLGVMSYLNHLAIDDDKTPLLKNVKYISSASGGTFTAALYALYNANGETFNTLYHKLFESLNGQDLLEKTLKILNDDTEWAKRPDKSPNLINAFAMAYDTDILFKGKTVSSLINNAETINPLEEVCFNSTEFYKGASFRQQLKLMDDPDSAKDKCFYYGSEYAWVAVTNEKEKVNPDLKLADILAASSCFPGGFEPFIYPNDFTYKNDKDGLTIQQLQDALTLNPQNKQPDEDAFRKGKTFGLMDGGVDDNQALDSLMAADLRRINNETSFKRFDLILVNDVDSYFMDPYQVAQKPKTKQQKNKSSIWDNINFNSVKIALFTIFGFSLLCLFILACIMLYGHRVSGLLKVSLAAMGFLLFGLTAVPVFLYDFLISKLTEKDTEGNSKRAKGLDLEDNFSPEIIKSLTSYFDKTKLSVIGQMVSERLRSVLMLTNDVFMNRIRQIIYENFYNTPLWKYRHKGNHIYDLSISNNMFRKDNLPECFTQVQKDFLEPTQPIQNCAENAFNMATTLWFDNAQTNMRRDIISCGQFTTCNNLIEYIYVLQYTDEYKNVKNKAMIERILKQLEEDWGKFKDDPYFLYAMSSPNP